MIRWQCFCKLYSWLILRSQLISWTLRRAFNIDSAEIPTHAIVIGTLRNTNLQNRSKMGLSLKSSVSFLIGGWKTLLNLSVLADNLGETRWQITDSLTETVTFLRSAQWKLTPVLGMNVNRESVIWLFLKIPRWITISIESSRRDLFIDMVVDGFIFKNNHITLSSCFTFIPNNRCGTT